MKYTIYLISVLMLTGFSSAVVGYNGSGGDMHIMSSGSSASASTAVGPNGTEYRAEVSMLNRSGQVQNDTVSGVEFQPGEKPSVSFQGMIRAGTPCHVIDHQIEESGETSYTLNVKTVKDSLDNSSFCVQQVVMIDYAGSFETNEPFRLTVEHNGEEVRTLEHPGYEDGKEPVDEHKKNGGFFANLSNWFSSLF